jgi:hypothetical protein
MNGNRAAIFRGRRFEPEFISTCIRWYLLSLPKTTSAFELLDLRPAAVGGEFIKSRGDRRLVKTATVLPPPIRDKAHRLFAFVDTKFWRSSMQSGMTTIAVENNLGTREALPPGRPWSRIKSGPGILDVGFLQAAPQMDAT